MFIVSVALPLGVWPTGRNVKHTHKKCERVPLVGTVVWEAVRTRRTASTRRRVCLGGTVIYTCHIKTVCFGVGADDSLEFCELRVAMRVDKWTDEATRSGWQIHPCVGFLVNFLPLFQCNLTGWYFIDLICHLLNFIHQIDNFDRLKYTSDLSPSNKILCN